MNLFQRFREKNRRVDETKETVTPDVGREPGILRNGKMVTVDLDSFEAESQKALAEEVIRRNGLALFEGNVTHGYSKKFLGNVAICPLCQSATQRRAANFIYATDIATRAMLAPAGFFCTTCPTVIVDEQMVATGVKHGYTFRRVVGIDYFGKKDPDYFGTWNGEKPIYILDEDEQIMDMVVDGDHLRSSGVPSGPHLASRKKAKAKRKQAAKARKRNRRK
ncbi:MAG: hypothetical protein HQ523_11480 [Lentisphaerae bacterium]|nr:hypothetical protein [Lentisphaerota bacterium]